MAGPTLSRRDWLFASAAAAACSSFKLNASPKSQTQGPAAQKSAGGAQSNGRYITPEQFGARGDGLTNDTDAFAAMAAYINRHGGGTIALQATTYLVGKQAPDPTQAGYYLAAAKIMHFDGCTKSLSIDR